MEDFDYDISLFNDVSMNGVFLTKIKCYPGEKIEATYYELKEGVAQKEYQTTAPHHQWRSSSSSYIQHVVWRHTLFPVWHTTERSAHLSHQMRLETLDECGE